MCFLLHGTNFFRGEAKKLIFFTLPFLAVFFPCRSPCCEFSRSTREFSATRRSDDDMNFFLLFFQLFTFSKSPHFLLSHFSQHSTSEEEEEKKTSNEWKKKLERKIESRARKWIFFFLNFPFSSFHTQRTTQSELIRDSFLPIRRALYKEWGASHQQSLCKGNWDWIKAITKISDANERAMELRMEHDIQIFFATIFSFYLVHPRQLSLYQFSHIPNYTPPPETVRVGNFSHSQASVRCYYRPWKSFRIFQACLDFGEAREFPYYSRPHTQLLELIEGRTRKVCCWLRSSLLIQLLSGICGNYTFSSCCKTKLFFSSAVHEFT